MKFISLSVIVLLLTVTLAREVLACTKDNVDDPDAIPQLILPKAKPSSWEQESYYHDLLRLILARTEAEFGPCELEQTEHVLSRMRSAALISRDQGVDLFWGSTTLEREALLHPIRIPLLKGLMGQKTLLIHRDNQALFSAVHNVDDLRKLRAGQGADWPDVKIFLHNNLSVVTSANYEALYKMLAAKRFDFFPRGANQLLSELRHNADINLVPEKDLVLVYPAPLYFFVKKGNDSLAGRVEKGLRAMMADGSFDRYFYRHPLIVDAILNLRLQERRVIRIDNPLLPPDTFIEKSEDWMGNLRRYNPELFPQKVE